MWSRQFWLFARDRITVGNAAFLAESSWSMNINRGGERGRDGPSAPRMTLRVLCQWTQLVMTGISDGSAAKAAAVMNPARIGEARRDILTGKGNFNWSGLETFHCSTKGKFAGSGGYEIL